MPRPIMQGLWIERRDITGWRVVIGEEEYTNLAPGPIAEVEVELDSIGCLTSGSIKLKRPRHPVFPPYAFTAALALETRSRGWIDVALGYVPPYSVDDHEEYALELKPLDELLAGGYYGDVDTYNTLGTEVADWKETYDAVVQRILKRYPTAMCGTDAAGRHILSRPEDGECVDITPLNFYEWKSAGLVPLPYATEARWDGGPGWAKGQYNGPVRAPFTPRKAVDAGEVSFIEKTRTTGPALVNRVEVSFDSSLTPPYRQDDLRLLEVLAATGSIVASGISKKKITAEQYALVEVWDFQRWYEGSAVAGQDSELVTNLKAALLEKQATYTYAQSAYGTGAVVDQAYADLASVTNQMRLAQIDLSNQQSYYEPLSARLSAGFVAESFGMVTTKTPIPEEKKPSVPSTPTLPTSSTGTWAGHDGYTVTYIEKPADAKYTTTQAPMSIITGITMWISTSSWDGDAVGYLAPDPTAPAGGDSGTDNSDLIHPLRSHRTLKVVLATLAELDSTTTGTPFQQAGLTIPEDYFRGPMAPALAGLMDNQWLTAIEDDDVAWQNKGYTTIISKNGAALNYNLVANTIPAASSTAQPFSTTTMNWPGQPGFRLFGWLFGNLPAPATQIPTSPPITADTQPSSVPPGMHYEAGVLVGVPAQGVHEFTFAGQPYVVLAYGAPPSTNWDGKWFFHVAYWWRQSSI